MEYWDECIRTAFDDAGIVATEEQIGEVVACVEGAHENYGMHHGHDAIPNPLTEEIGKLRRELKTERDKAICPDCNGNGLEYKHPTNPVYSIDCSACRGEGRRTL